MSIFSLPASNFILWNQERKSVVMVGSEDSMNEQASKLNEQYQTDAYVVRPYNFHEEGSHV